MTDWLQNTHSLTEAIDTCEERLSEAPEETTWKYRRIYRCLKGLADPCATLHDRGALIRDLTRVQNNVVTLPIQGTRVAPKDKKLLRKFGLDLHFTDKLTIRLDESISKPDLPADFWNANTFDSSMRRHFEHASGDGLLRRLSPYSDYLNITQKSAVRNLVSMPPASTLLVSMPTGAGKSLVFQLGIRWWREKWKDKQTRPCAVVIVPTVSLAYDHQRHACQFPGLENCRALTGEIQGSERRNIIRRFVQGEIPLLFVSPELALGQLRRPFVEMAREPEASERSPGVKGHLVGVFIDEAHVVIDWGRRFRPEYQRLGGLVRLLRKKNADLRTVLLSATVGPHTHEMLRKLFPGERGFLNVFAHAPRPELDLVVEQLDAPDERRRTLRDLLYRIPRPAILYTTIRKAREAEDEDEAQFAADSLHEYLSEEIGYGRIALYTGETDREDQEDILQRWDSEVDKLDLVVATSAFGMGVDKPDVRSVIHVCLPESPARYYQEIGRAARDGRQGLAVCLWSEEDKRTAVRMATSDWMKKRKARERWRSMHQEAQATEGLQISEQGDPILALPLYATRPYLPPVKRSYDKAWNMSLLNLFERHNLIDVFVAPSPEDEQIPPEKQRHFHREVPKGREELEDDEPMWRVRVLESQLLDATSGDDWLEERVHTIRRDERSRAVERLSCLIDGFRDVRRRCLLTTVFRMVDAKADRIKACGRCPACRQRGVRPPNHYPLAGAQDVWSQSLRPDSGEVRVVHPENRYLEDGFERLVRRLDRAFGCAQFVVPDRMVEDSLAVLNTLRQNPGLIVPVGSLINQPHWDLAPIPTAVLMPLPEPESGHYERVWELLKDFARTNLLIVVAPPGFRIGHRRLSQVVSRRAPVSETNLDA